MDGVRSVGGAGYVPEDDDLGVTASGGDGLDPLASELATDRAERDGLALVTSGPSTRTTTPERAMADAFVAGGWEGVDARVDSHPDEVRELVARDRDAVEMSVESALVGARGGGLVAQARGWWDADAVVDHLAERFAVMAHERVRGEATSAIRTELAALETTTPEALLRELRGAPDGSDFARLAEELGLDGGALDLDRVQMHVRTAREELTLLRDALEGQTWSPDELPGTSARVLVEMGLVDVARGSIAFEAFHRDTLPEAAHETASASFDAVHTAFEMAHVAHEVGSIAAAGPMAVAVAAVAFGIALHHAIEENRMERREAARHLGL